MIWKEHLELKNKHAFMSASQPYWLNDTPAELKNRYVKEYSQSIGTILHEYAASRIKYGIKLYKNDKHDVIFYLLDKGIPEHVVYSFNTNDIFETLFNYINDCIGFRMRTEQILYYSKNSFGTADAICFRDNILRVSDLKTGTSQVKIDQLLIYCALFCLEYGYNPDSLTFEVRFYQSKEMLLSYPTADEIKSIMNKIISNDKIINNFLE